MTGLGRKLIDAVYANGYRFTQQYDPFSGKASLVRMSDHQPAEEGSGEAVQDAYGPTMLACLEYIAHHYGIHPHLGQVWFSLGSGAPCAYEAAFCDRHYAIRSDGQRAEIRVDGKALGSWKCGRRIVTDEDGLFLWAEPIEDAEET